MATIARPLRFKINPVLAYRTLRLFSSTYRQHVFHSQAEDPAASAFLSAYQQNSSRVPQTLSEKIFQQHAIGLPKGKFVRSGDFITLSPAAVMTHDNSWPVAKKFMEMGATQIHNPQQLVMTLDHDVQNHSESNLKKYRLIQEFAKQNRVDFYPAGHGIGHQIMCEEGYAWPGTLAAASDSHSNMYGGLGCLGTPLVRSGAADIWATGSTWFKIPPIAKVTFLGVLPKGVTGKDVIVTLCGLFSNDEVLNHAIEFQGSEETLRSLPIDDRLAISNMTTEWGALSGLFPIDSLLLSYMRYKATAASLFSTGELATHNTISRINHARIDALEANPLTADRNARYAKSLFLDLSSVPPYVSGPNSVKIAKPVQELAARDIKINKAYLVSCTNSRASDLAAAAAVFKNAPAPARIAPHVQLFIAAASAAEQAAAEAAGDWQVLLAAGAQPLPAGCGPCIGLGTGLLEEGEVGISASNRNFKGRMGSAAAQAYLASPEVVAASALKGVIAGPGLYEPPAGYAGVIGGAGDGITARFVGVEEALEKLVAQAEELVEAGEATATDPAADAAATTTAAAPTASIVPGFPTHVSGELVFCNADNINTDGIYPGKYTYQDSVPAETMAAVCMENYDRAFAHTARAGDILVSGFNFGCGSSREQAATALLAKGVPLVLGGSFGNIFATNSINNALMALEAPALLARLRAVFGPPAAETQLTRRTGWTVVWDVGRSVLEVREGPDGKVWSEKVTEIPEDVQRIVAGGGLVKTRQAMFGKGERS